MVLHIFNNQIKFSVKYFEFLNDYEEDFSNHKLFHYGKKNKFYDDLPELESKFCKTFLHPFPHFWLNKKMKEADKIIIHSLASPLLICMLLFNKKLLSKSYWVIWGKDLYIHRDATKFNLPVKLYEILRKPVIKRIGHVITYIDGDYELAVDWYNMNAVKEKMDKNYYPYSVDAKVSETVNNNQELKVLLGNSGSKTNKHLDALNKLKSVDDGKLQIYSPLSYGGKKSYVNKVILQGKEMFGDRFHPITGFMEYKEYMDMLNSIDIAFFYHDRQEALNNTISLIAKKKTVYIRSDVTSWDLLVDKKFNIKDSLKLCDQLSTFSKKELDENGGNISSICEPEFTYKQWSKIFQ